MTGGDNLGNFAYDERGNPTTYNGVGFTWNAQDNLTAIDNASNFTAGYTADGLRAWKAASGAGTAQTYFLYDGSIPIIEMDGLVSRWESQYDQSSSGTSGASDPLSGSSFSETGMVLCSLRYL